MCEVIIFHNINHSVVGGS